MASKTEIVAFFGDQQYRLRLSVELVSELERQVGVGIGSLNKRVLAGHFAIKDLIEIIRLGLIGGGVTPQRAKELIDTYTTDRPLLEYAPVAIDVLSALFVGPAQSTDEMPDAE